MTMTEREQTGICPVQTPWGRAQHIENIARGIWSVSTAGHGGIYVAPWRRATVPEVAYLLEPTGYSSNGWFEEDCDWALVCAAFPALFKSRDCFYAYRQATARGDYLKERWTKYLASELGDQLRKIAGEYALAHADELK